MEKTNDGKKGGWLVGKRHYDKSGKPIGGIPAVVGDSKRPVELEGGEVIINREASKKYWRELSKINQSAGNGVPIKPQDVGADEDPEEYKEGGKVIEFNPNHIPNKRIYNYAKSIKEDYPKVWGLGGNIFGNEAFKNLERVINRGYWTDNEEWMYIKWRSFVARHKGDFRIAGVIAMLKWVDKVDKGWEYMKNLIEAEIDKRYPKKKKSGGAVTYKNKYNKKYGYDKNESHDLSEISKDTGVSGKGLRQIYNKGVGAYKTNPQSVRPNVKSKEQWAMGRVYSAVMGGKAARVDAKELKMEHGGSLDTSKFKDYTKTIAKRIKDAGYNISTSFSKTDFGESHYITVRITDSPEDYSNFVKIRISDHSVENPERIKNEVHLQFSSIRKDIDETVNSLLKEIRFRLERSKYFTEKQGTDFKIGTLEVPEQSLKNDDKIISERHSSSKRGAGRKIFMVERKTYFPITKYIYNPTGDVFIQLKKYSEGGELYHLGGDMSKHLAPNGKPSNLNHEQWHLVRTPEFKAWFGDWENDPANASKVVDENGEPLVVYHGSNYNFNVFEESKRGSLGLGFYFTPIKEISTKYGNVKPYFLKIKNNLSIINRDAYNFFNFFGGKEKYYELIESNELSKAEVRKKIIENNYDGIIDYYFREYITYYPEQIKLADGTNTTFDGSNSDIRYEDGGSVEHLISEGIVDLKMYDTTNEHSKLYGFDAKNPLYIQSIIVAKEHRNKGIGSKVMKYINDYAKKNEHDLIFGHITQKAQPNIDVIKSMMVKSGFNTCEGNNDFYKQIYADGGLIAPNGNPSNLTPEQYRLVRTPEFKAWFGDWENDPKNASKVVDENGEPLVVWHGGKQNIRVFKTPTHLGTLPSAMERVNDIFFWKPNFKSDYYECFIDIKKPYKTTDVGIKKEWAKEVRLAKKENFDGLIYKNLHENRGSISYVVFDPNQIKLADGTNTTFDSNNPDIRYEAGGELAKGIKTEQEHKDTLEKIASGEITVNQAIKMTAKDHLKENPKYYTELAKIEKHDVGGALSSYALKTPNGEKSRLTYLQQILVRTEKFKEFFGDWETAAKNYLLDNKENYKVHFKNVSKVMDMSTLEPRVVYHGTRSDAEFFTFDVSMEKGQGRPYAYFAHNREYSENFTEFSQRGHTNSSGYLYECFLNVRNPFMAMGHEYEFKLKDYEGWINAITGTIALDKYQTIEKNETTKKLEKAIRAQVEDYMSSLNNEENQFWKYMAADTKSVFKFFLISYGYDGIFYGEELLNNYDAENPKEYTNAVTIFSAKDIKLADGRNLNFNPMETDIRYEDGGSVEKPQKTMSKKDRLGSILFGEKYANGGFIEDTIGYKSVEKPMDDARTFVEQLNKKMKE